MRERGQFLGKSWVLADLLPVDVQGLGTWGPRGPLNPAEQRRNREMK